MIATDDNEKDRGASSANDAPRRDGGTLTVSLLFVSAAAIAVAVFVGSRTYLASEDTLSRLVPLEAQLYVHSDVAAYPGILPPSAVPDDIVPDEWAVFAVSDDGSALRFGTLVAWRPLLGPDENTRRSLASAGAQLVAPRTYLFGADALTDGVRAVSVGAAQPLVSDRRIAEGLASMHDLFLVQGYLEPRLLALLTTPEDGVVGAEGLAAALSALRAADPFVFSLANDGTEAAAVVAPLEAATRIPVIGFRMPATDRRGPSPADPDAAVSYTDIASKIDPVNTIFWMIESARKGAGIPSSEFLTDARNVVRTTLMGRVSLSIDSRTENGRARFVARFGDAPPDAVASALAAYVNASFPEKAVVALPDKDISREYRIDENRFRFQPSVTPLGRDVNGLSVDEHGITIVVADDGTGGSLIATDPGDIDDYYSWNPGLAFRGCDERNADASLHLREKILGLTEISIISLKQGILRICGR